MASAMDLSLRQRADAVTRVLKSLLNSDLKDICKSESLPISGVKATLQNRILDLINNAVISGDSERLVELQDKVYKSSSGVQRRYSPSTSQNPSHAASSTSPYRLMPVGYRPSTGTGHGHPHFATYRIQFKESPFYTMKDQLSDQMELPVMNVHRHTVQNTLRIDDQKWNLLKSDPSQRVMLYCAPDLGVYNGSKVDIAFPNQVEVKVNSEVVQANLRGIKKKPGSTKPADITAYVRKYANIINVIYAATEKKYAMLCYLVRKHSVDELVSYVKRGNRISKRTVVQDMISKANDPDIEATSTIMSLKCPLSATRMQLPCRSAICNHNQCFDASSFLQVQEQAPQWSCPICNKMFHFEHLAVDEYVQDILASTSKSTEQITIEPDGTWHQAEGKDGFLKPNGPAKKPSTEPLEFDDLVELHDYRINGFGGSSTPQSFIKTPSSASREPSTAPARSSLSGKRPAAEVIDLTLSDEEEAPRPIKRQSTGSFPGGQLPLSLSSRSPNGIAPFALPTHRTGSEPSWKSPVLNPQDRSDYQNRFNL